MNRPADAQRRRTKKNAAGRRAEFWAAWLYRLWGWRILDQRVRLPMGEIDLIARRGRVLAFIEVKHRPSLNEAAAAILPAQQERIERAAAQWLARRPDLAHLHLRFDAALTAPRRFPRLIADAWRRET